MSDLNQNYFEKITYRDALRLAMHDAMKEDKKINAYWNKKNNVISLLTIRMTKGVYNLEDGDNDFLNLNAEIEDKLNKQLKPYCYLRSGSSCEFTEAQKLKIKD